MIRKHLMLLILAAVFCAACLPVKTTTSRGPAEAPATPEAALAEAEAAYGQGQYQVAADQYKRYLAAVPNPPRMESILANYGHSAEKSGLYADAIVAYERLLRDFPSGSSASEAVPRLAVSYIGAGQYAKVDTLGRERLNSISDPEKHSRLRLAMGQAQWLQGRYQTALSSFLEVRRKGEGEVRQAAEEGALATLARLTPTALGDVQKGYGQNFPGPEATYLLIYRALEAGDQGGAAAHSGYFNQYFSGHTLAPKVAELSALAAAAPLPALAIGAGYDPRPKAAPGPIAGTPVVSDLMGLSGRYTIAAILPVGDPGAQRFAGQVLNGLKLALSRAGGGGSVGLMVLDTRGSGEEAARLVAQAASDSQVMVAVGPLLSREALPAAQAAERAGLPMISISQRMDLTTIGPNIFRLFLTPKHQAEAVARYAVNVQGHRSLGILYPEDGYGRSMRTYFENEARRQGATVTAGDSYDYQSGNWREVVARLTGGKVARKVSTSYQANVGFTALFMPDAPGPVSEIIPMLAFHDVTRMQYLGAPLWLNPEFLTGTGRYIQGAVIPVALSDLSQRAETQSFISAYQSAYGHAPDQFAAYGYDAGLAVINALGRGSSSRAEVRRALAQSRGIAGATGPFGFASDGEFLLDPTLITVQDQEFILLRDALGAIR